MKWTIATILVLLLLTFLAVSKPSEADFQSWARANIRADDNADLLERGMMFVLRTQMNLETLYRDYTILAIVDTRVLDIRLRYLGIAGQWFLLAKEEPSEQRSGAGQHLPTPSAVPTSESTTGGFCFTARSAPHRLNL